MNPNINNNGNTPVSHTGLSATTTNASVGGNNPQQRVHYPQGGTPGSLSVHGALQQNNGGYVNPMGHGPTSFSGNVQQPINQYGDGSLPAVVYYISNDSLPQARVVQGLNTDAYSSHPHVQSQGGSFQRFLLQQPSVQVVTGSPAGGQSSGHTTVTPQSTHRSIQDRQGTQTMSTSSTAMSLLQRRPRSLSPSQSSQSSQSSQRLTQRRRLHSPPVGTSVGGSSSAAASGSAAQANPGFMTVQQYRNSMPINVPDRDTTRVCGLIAIGTFVGVPLPLEWAQQYVAGRPEMGLTSDESAEILSSHFGVPTTSRNFYSIDDAATVRQELQRMVQQGGFDRVLVHHHWTDPSNGALDAHQFTIMQVNGQWWCYDANPRNPPHLPYVVPDLAVFLAQSFEEASEGQRGLELLTSNGLPPRFTANLQRYQADAEGMQPVDLSVDSVEESYAEILSSAVARRTELLSQLVQILQPLDASLANCIQQLDPASANEDDISLVIRHFSELTLDEQGYVRHIEGAESTNFTRILLRGDRQAALSPLPSVATIADAWNQLRIDQWEDAAGYWQTAVRQSVPTPEQIPNGAGFFRAERRHLHGDVLDALGDVTISQRLDDAIVLMNMLGEPVPLTQPPPREGQSHIDRLADTLRNDYQLVPRTISFTDLRLMRVNANNAREDRGIALMYRTENDSRIESSIQFRRQANQVWRVHVPETSTSDGAWIRIAGRIGDYLFSRVNSVQLAGPVEILWLRGGIPREGNLVVPHLLQRMINAMGPADVSTGSNSPRSSRRSSDASDASMASMASALSSRSIGSGTNNDDNGTPLDASGTDSEESVQIDDVNDNFNDNVNDSDRDSTPDFIGSPASVPDVFSNNDNDGREVQYIAENDPGTGPDTQIDDLNDNVSLSGSVSSRTSDIGSQSGSDNVSLSSSIDSMDGVGNDGSDGSTNYPAYMPILDVEGNRRRWMALHDRLMATDIHPTAGRYRILETASALLHFLEDNPQPVNPGSTETTRNVEELLNNREAFVQAWQAQRGGSTGNDQGNAILNYARLGLWNATAVNNVGRAMRHASLLRAFDSELRSYAQSLTTLYDAFSAVAPLIALIPEGDPVAHIRSLSPEQRQNLVEQRLSRISSTSSATRQQGQVERYRRFADAFIAFVVYGTSLSQSLAAMPGITRQPSTRQTVTRHPATRQTEPRQTESRQERSSARPHIMQSLSDANILAVLRNHLRTFGLLETSTTGTMMYEIREFGTWLSTAHVQQVQNEAQGEQGESLAMMANRYMNETFPEGRQNSRYGGAHRAIFTHLFGFLNTYYGNPNATTQPLTQPVVQRPDGQ